SLLVSKLSAPALPSSAAPNLFTLLLGFEGSQESDQSWTQRWSSLHRWWDRAVDRLASFPQTDHPRIIRLLHTAFLDEVAEKDGSIPEDVLRWLDELVALKIETHVHDIIIFLEEWMKHADGMGREEICLRFPRLSNAFKKASFGYDGADWVPLGL